MGMKIIVVYKSSTGFTKRYAEMIAEEMQCELADYKEVTAEMLAGYDVILFGSRAHAGMIDGYKKARELFRQAAPARLVLFVTGATPNAAEETIREFWSNNLSADELREIPHFYMQSGLCYEKMSFSDRLMMKVAAVMIKKKKDKTAEEKEMEQAITRSYDISSKKYIEPLVEYLRG